MEYKPLTIKQQCSKAYKIGRTEMFFSLAISFFPMFTIIGCYFVTITKGTIHFWIFLGLLMCWMLIGRYLNYPDRWGRKIALSVFKKEKEETNE